VQPWTIERLCDGCHRVALAPTPLAAPPFDTATNVFVLQGGGQGLCLVNAGALAQRDALVAALASLGHLPGEVERVATTSLSPHLIGGAVAFPDADLISLRPPDGAVSRWGAALVRQAHDPELSALRAIAQSLPRSAPRAPAAPDAPALPAAQAQAQPKVKTVRRGVLAPLGAMSEGVGGEASALPGLDVDAVLAQVAAWEAMEWPQRALLIPDGWFVTLGEARWQVISTPGVGFGGAWAWLEPESGRLISGDFLHDQHEACWLRDLGQVSKTLDRLEALGARWLWPNEGVCTSRPDWAFRHLSRYVSNFLSHLPHALDAMISAPVLVERDQSLARSAPMGFVMAVRGYQAFAEALLADGLIDSQGDGPLRRYGAAGVKRSRVMVERPGAGLF
jgi:glyoxylase-like metal-dependent hydrolase (beta-lactamase superfamily II)